MPHLKVISRKAALEMEFDGALVIGRHIANSLPVPDTEISRRHAQIFPRDGKYIISDLASRNGVYVNGEKVKERALKPGDEIALGMSLFFFDPPKDTSIENMLSPRGEVLWQDFPPKPEFQPFQVTTYSHGELEEILGDWLSHPASLPLLSLPVTAKFLDFMLRSDDWGTRKDLCQGALQFLQERIGGERLILMAVDPKKHNLQAQAVIGPNAESDFPISKDVIRVVIDGERAVYCSNCEADFRFSKMSKQSDYPVGSFVSTPIFYKAQHYGFIYADSPPGKSFFEYKSLIQTYLAASLFAQCIHWLNVGRSKRSES